MTTLYHRTTGAAAQDILRNGFRDGSGSYLTMSQWSGVWFSDRPLDANDGADGDMDTLLCVEIEFDLADFEWVEEGKEYREYLIPADLINQRGTTRVVRGAVGEL